MGVHERETRAHADRPTSFSGRDPYSVTIVMMFSHISVGKAGLDTVSKDSIASENPGDREEVKGPR